MYYLISNNKFILIRGTLQECREYAIINKNSFTSKDILEIVQVIQQAVINTTINLI